MHKQRQHAGKIESNRMAVDWSTFVLRQTAMARDFQQGIAQLYSMATGAVSTTQAQAGELVELMGRSIRVKAGLLQQASAAAQAVSLPESQTRWLSFWVSACRLANDNANRLARINGTALNSWMRLVQNGMKARSVSLAPAHDE